MAQILILDDDNVVREMMSAGLEAQGHEVMQAASLAEARKATASRMPELILIDLVLPDGDGLEYIKELQSKTKTKGIPIIVVSALRLKKKIVEGLNAGAVDYITKPFELVELRVRVTAALKLHELRKAEEKNRTMDAMRETAKTVQYEIEMPLQEIQKCLIQLSNESEDFNEKDKTILNEARDHLARLESILSHAQHLQG